MKPFFKYFLRNCNYVGEEIKRRRHIYGKWHVYFLRSNDSLEIYGIYLSKEITNANPYQIDDVHISIPHVFPDVLDNINKLLKRSTNTWNSNEHKPIWRESLRLPPQTFVGFALEN